MDGTELFLRLVGAFYVFAGYIATRATLMSLFMDRAIAAIGATKPKWAETARHYWLLVAAAIVLSGGVALMALLDVAAALFLLSAAGQAVYLFFIAPHVLDGEDPPDAVGRRQSTNAFVIYLAATALVVWALSTGKLIGVWQANPGVIAVAGAAVALHIGHVAWTLARTRLNSPLAGLFSGHDGATDWQSTPGTDPATSRTIKVMADYGTHPLWALDPDMYGDISPEALGLSPELTRDLTEWGQSFSASLDEDNPAESRWSDAERAAHEAMARPLAIRLARELPDRTIYVLQSDVGVVEVRADEDLPPSGGARVT